MALFRKQSSPPVLFVHVEGGAVSVAAVCMQDKPKVLLSDRKELPTAERTVEQLEQQTASMLQEVLVAFLERYSKSDHAQKRPPLSTVDVHFGPTFAEADTAHATVTFPKPQIVTDGLIAETAKQAVALLPKSDRTVLESLVTRVHVNMYPTGKPVGKLGESLGVSVFRSGITESARRRIDEALHTALPGHTPLYRSFARDLMHLLREASDSPYHLVIDIEEGKSHCISLRDDEIAAHATVPIGTGSVLSKIAGTGSLEETRTLIRLAAKDSCSTAACEEIKTKLAAVEPLLVKTFGDGFATLSSVYRLPNTCLILAQPDLSPWLEHVFSRLDFAQFTVTSQPLTVSPLHAAVRGRVIQDDAHVDGWLETSIAATSLYTNAS